MDTELFAKRTSVRSYAPTPVPQEVVQHLLEAAIQAPSGGNCQPWHFYVVRNAEVKHRLSVHSYSQKFIEQAPLVIVVCAEAQRSAKKYGERGEELYCLQDTAAAVENILLCAVQHGLGGCWCGAFDEGAVSEAMGLPADRRPVAILPIGYPEGTPRKPRRRPLEEVTTYMD